MPLRLCGSRPGLIPSDCCSSGIKAAEQTCVFVQLQILVFHRTLLVSFFMCLSVTVCGEMHEEETNSIKGAPRRTSTARHLSYWLHLLAFPSPNLPTLLIAAFVLLISAALYLPRVKPVSFALCSLTPLLLPPLASAVRFPLNTLSIFDSNRRTEQRYRMVSVC